MEYIAFDSHKRYTFASVEEHTGNVLSSGRASTIAVERSQSSFNSQCAVLLDSHNKILRSHIA